MILGDAKNDPNGKVWVCQLKTGDYIIDDWVIEVKEINDLASPITGVNRDPIVGSTKDMTESNPSRNHGWCVRRNC